MTVLLRAAVALACRRRSPAQLRSHRKLLKRSTAFERPCYLSSVARNTPENHDPSAVISRTDYWYSMYRELREFFQRHGHAHVPIQYEENFTLGRWVETQRHQYRRRKRGEQSTLTPEREERLEKLGMVWNIRDYVWEENYEQLLEYYYTHGHVNVPARYPGGLGRWIYKQRKDYHARQRGEQTQLTTDRMVRLSALGMIWSIPEATWDESYQQLVDFKEKHGHANVPTDPQDPLAVWVHIQRREYKHFQGGDYSRMTQERVDRLNELNFQWDYQEAVWHEKYKELCQYRQEYGHCIVPKSNPSLGRWVGQQREQYKKFREAKTASISPERIEMLEKIDFVWNAQDALWRQRVDELDEFVKVNGFGSAPPIKTHRSLGRWLQRQEQAYQRMKNGEKVAMNEERATELQRLGFLIHL